MNTTYDLKHAIEEVSHKKHINKTLSRVFQSIRMKVNNEIDNLKIVNKILEVMGKSEDLIEFVDDRPGHDYRYSLDSSKINQDLNWGIKKNFDEGISRTVEWYQKNIESYSSISHETLKSTPWKN